MMTNPLAGKFQSSRTANKNIESAWRFIAGGLQAHQSCAFINKYGLIHIIRQIDGYYAFPPTSKVCELLNYYSIEYPKYWSSKDRKKYNSILKKLGCTEQIQIEHLNGGVKHLVELLANLNLTGILEHDMAMLKSLHHEQTKCCYKLLSETELNDSSDVSMKNIKKFFRHLTD
jgi:hypothetical protein